MDKVQDFCFVFFCGKGEFRTMIKKKSGFQIASIVLVFISLLVSVVKIPLQAYIFEEYDMTYSTVSLISACINVIPNILLLIAFIFFYDKSKSNVMLLAALIAKSLCMMYTMIANFAVIEVVYFAVFVLVTIDCLMKFKFIRVSFIVFTSYTILTLIGMGTAFFTAVYFYYPISFYFTNLIYYLGGVCFAVSLLLYFRYRFINAPKKQMHAVVSMETSLLQIKAMYEQGEITEEEYSRKKAEILNKL